MCKYSKTITLESIDGFKPVKFTVSEADSIQQCDEEIRKWLKDYPELTKIENNKKIIAWTLRK